MHLEQVQAAFSDLVESGLLGAAFDLWRQRSPAVARFQRVDDLMALVTSRDRSEDEARNVALEALCQFAKTGDQEAAVFLLWIFGGAFRSIRREIGDSPLSTEELESEMTAAFWEGVTLNQGSDKLAGRLFYRVLQAAWRAVRSARSEINRRADLYSEIVDASQKCADPSAVIQEACDQAVVDQVGAELILATRVDGSSITKIASELRLSPEAAGMRRKRAERALVGFLSSKGGFDGV